mgnify:CR=1 FL=1
MIGENMEHGTELNRFVFDLSIIIPVYNASLLINRCLDSIFLQSTQYSYEVILVDDGSTDNSVEVIKTRKEKNIILFQQQNAGPSVARNKGVELAHGKYVTFIDADDYWENGYIDSLIGFLEKYQECVAVSCVCKNLVLGKTATYNPTSFRDEMVVDGNGYRTSEPFVLKDFFSYWAKECHVGTCSTVIRADIARKSDGMRTDLRVSEDYEYWFTIASMGKCGVVPKVLYVSDGDAVTSANGWLNKMKRRWENAPAISEWEKRVMGIAPFLSENEGYRLAIGRVSRNLTYCQLLSGRTRLARQEALRYGNYFTKDAIGKLMNLAKWTAITWWGLCKFLKWREYHRK